MAAKFSTKNARRSGVSADLDRWLRMSDPDDKVTVIYRVPTFADPDAIASALSKVGVSSESIGKHAIVGTVAQKDFTQSLNVKGVLGVEMPSRLSTKTGSGLDNGF
jgi:hypothetical protein